MSETDLPESELPRSELPQAELPEGEAPSPEPSVTEVLPEAKLALECEHDARLQWALQQNDVPLVKRVRVTNEGEESLEDLRVEVRVGDELAEPWTARLAALSPGGSWNLEEVRLNLRPDRLRSQLERERVHLKVEVLQGARILATKDWPLEVLAFNEWAGIQSLPELTAAFVLPNHPDVEQVLRKARALLQERTGDPALAGYQAPDRQVDVMRAVYDALFALDIAYVEPPASYEFEGQKVRLPDQILRTRSATCFDLALIYAACLEQSGFFPLIVLIEGHAFCAVWSKAEGFGEPGIEDGLRIRKRVQLDEIRIVDPTAVSTRPDVSFEAAVRLAERHLEDLSTFRLAVDIRAARKLRVRPLPVAFEESDDSSTASSDGGAPPERIASVSDAPPPSIPAAPNFEPEAVVPTAPSGRVLTPIEERLERWKGRLLDLSLRNRFLNFRESKRTIPLQVHSLGDLEDALAKGKTFELAEKPDLGEGRGRDLSSNPTGEERDALGSFLASELGDLRLRTTLTPAELDKRQLEIYRTARNSLEESGANTLYLALGFLRWKQSPTVERRAPVLLIPLEILRPSVREGIRIRLAEDDPRVNTTLLEWLRREHGLETAGLEDLPEDEAGLDVDKILRGFRAAVRDLDGWEIVDEVAISLFSFTKFLMWRDLEERWNTLAENRVARFLLERPDEAFDPEGGFPDAATLDAERQPRETFCPMSADSSQLAAIFAAQDGKSFVLEGPPGTGKSQTITNLIAHALGRGQRVLFVSEKRAALEVVQRRLEKVGLGPFCLELHSNKVSKRAVLEQLRESLESAGSRSPESWGQSAEELGSIRGELNGVVEALHRDRALGFSVFDATSRLVGMRDLPRVDLGDAEVSVWDADRLRGVMESLDKLDGAAKTLETIADHDLLGIGLSQWGQDIANGVPGYVEAATAASRALPNHLAAAARTLGLSGDGALQPSREGLEDLVGLAGLLVDAPSHSERLLDEPGSRELWDRLAEWIERGRKREAREAKLFERWEPDVLSLDLESTAARIRKARGQMWPLSWFGLWRARGSVKSWCKKGLPSDAVLLQDLAEGIALQQEEKELSPDNGFAGQLFGMDWRKGRADWDHLERMIAWTRNLRDELARHSKGEPVEHQRLRERWGNLARLDAAGALADGAKLADLRAFLEATHGFAASRTALEQPLEVIEDQAYGPADQGDFLGSFEARARRWSNSKGDLDRWCFYRRTRDELAGAGLGSVPAALEVGDAGPGDARRLFERSFLEDWLGRETQSDPLLRDFHSPEHERRIARFRDLDQQFLELTEAHLASILAASVPRVDGNAAASSEVGILVKELRKKSRHMPVRKLFERLPNVLSRLKPCVLMSPLSVAQYLDAGVPAFDIVVFDEASQIPVWDAIGAIARAKQSVVVGDSKQLPPTSFFQRMDDEDDSWDEDDLEELESLLDECAAARMTPLQLEWHYRSRHESLIAFSNHHYYSNRLMTFPSPAQEVEGRGVSLRYMENGVYDKGKTRANRVEAQALVDEIVRRLRIHGSERSVGAVTFSKAQQDLVLELLDEERRKDPKLEPCFTDESPEPVFVKNLENVQGDERDVILLSVGYGPDPTGRVSMNFGPLNRQGGERRLNVAVTRAREELVLFSSIRADQIDLARTSAVGARDLKSFLDYAARGPQSIAEATEIAALDRADSALEEDIAKRLAERGHRVVNQVGCSGYRVDVAIEDPENPGECALGIECDGENYRQSQNARDRDRTRPAVMAGLGWTLLRVWSADWWRNPEREIERIEEALATSLAAPSGEGAIIEPEPAAPSDGDSDGTHGVPTPGTRGQATPPESTNSDSEAVDEPDEPQGSNNPVAPVAEDGTSRVSEPEPFKSAPPTVAQAPDAITVATYKPYARVHAFKESDEVYEGRNDARITKRILAVVAQESPIHLELLLRRVATSFGLERLTSKLRRRLEDILDNIDRTEAPGRDGDILWTLDQNPDTWSTFRTPTDDPDTKRESEELPPAELAAATALVLERNISLPEEDLLKEVGRLFGFTRVGKSSRDDLRAGLALLLVRGECLLEEGQVRVPR